MTTRFHRLSILAAACLFGLAVSAAPALSAGDPDGTRGPTAPPNDGGQKNTKKKKKNQSLNQDELTKAYKEARQLILDGKYEAGIARMHALGHDDNAEVANYIGYASRKLGDYDAARVWYDRALVADPNHTRTWQYYGMWQLEQGNMLKAEDYLEKIHVICGNTTCDDYLKLKDGINGNISY